MDVCGIQEDVQCDVACRSKIQKLQSLFSPKSNTASVDRSKMPPPQTPVVKRAAVCPPPASSVCASL